MPRPLSVDREPAALLQLDLDEGGVAGHRLVHGIVDHLGEEVVQGLLVGAADIHAGPAANRLQALQHLDDRTRRSRSPRALPWEARRETFAVAAFADPLRRARCCALAEEIVVVIRHRDLGPW